MHSTLQIKYFNYQCSELLKSIKHIPLTVYLKQLKTIDHQELTLYTMCPGFHVPTTTIPTYCNVDVVLQSIHVQVSALYQVDSSPPFQPI